MVTRNGFFFVFDWTSSECILITKSMKIKFVNTKPLVIFFQWHGMLQITNNIFSSYFSNLSKASKTAPTFTLFQLWHFLKKLKNLTKPKKKLPKERASKKAPKMAVRLLGPKTRSMFESRRKQVGCTANRPRAPFFNWLAEMNESHLLEKVGSPLWPRTNTRGECCWSQLMVVVVADMPTCVSQHKNHMKHLKTTFAKKGFQVLFPRKREN